MFSGKIRRHASVVYNEKSFAVAILMVVKRGGGGTSSQYALALIVRRFQEIAERTSDGFIRDQGQTFGHFCQEARLTRVEPVTAYRPP
jgi:hypothetical protein